MGLFSAITGIVGLGMSLFGHHQSRKAYKQQAGQIAEQRKLNEEVAAFNKSVMEQMYPETVEAIKLETRNAMARQLIAFAHSGADPSKSSPYMVFGETLRMGTKRLQEAYFNYNVDLKNEEFRAKGVLNSLDSEAINARYNARRASLGMFQAGIDGLSYFGSMFRNGNPFGSSSAVNLSAASRATESLNSAPLRNGKWTE